MQAKAYARIGDAAACIDQLGMAEAETAHIVETNEPAETGYVQPGNTKIKQAEALLKLGDTTAATYCAREAVESGDKINLRACVYGLATLSMTLAASAQVEESAAHAHRTLDEATGMESWRIRDRLTTMTEALRPFDQTPAAREFLERADAALSVRL